MKIILVVCFVAFCLPACRKKNREEAQGFYNTLNRVIDRAEVPLEQLSDSVIAIHTSLRSDNAYAADTVALKTLLQECISANQKALDSLNTLKDPSNDIGLKNTALIYVTDWKELLADEFSVWLTLLGRPMENKADYLSDMFTGSLKVSSELSKNLTEKSRAFKKEFDF